MAKRFYATLHMKDPVNGSSVAIGGIVGCDDMDQLIASLSQQVWRKNRRPSTIRVYRSDTEALVKEVSL